MFQECGYRFAHRSALIKHLRNVHNESIVLTPPNKPLKLVEKKEQSVLPPETAETAEVANKDESTELKPLAKKTKKGKQKEEKICEFCEKVFATNQKLKTHFKVTFQKVQFMNYIYVAYSCRQNLITRIPITETMYLFTDYISTLVYKSSKVQACTHQSRV